MPHLRGNYPFRWFREEPFYHRDKPGPHRVWETGNTLLRSNHATEWHPVNKVVSTGDPGNAESVVAVTYAIHAMEMEVNHPPSRLER